MEPGERTTGKNLKLLLWGGLLLRLWLIGQSDLMKEEAYYWNYAQHPALSYFDHPPFAAWLIGLSCSLGGDTPFFVRLPAVLLFAASTWLIYDLGRRMFDESTGFKAALILNLLPIFTIYSLTISPDSPLIFFWILGMWAGWRLVEGSPKWWWIVGLACGLGMISKYPALLVPLAPMLYFWLTRERGKWLDRHMLGAALLANLLLLPVLYWNVENDWASIRFQGGERMAQAAALGDKIGTWVIQLAVTGPTAFFFLLGSLGYAWKRREDKRYLYVLCCAGPFCALLLYVSLRRLVQLNWPLPAYLGLLIPTARMIGVRGLSTMGVWAALPWIFIFFFPGLIARYDDVSRWQELGDKALQIRAAMPRPQQTFLAGHGYQAASQLAFTTRLPQLTFSNNILGERALAYDFWQNPADYRGWDAVVCTYAMRTSGGNWRERTELDPEKLKLHFERVDEPETVTLEREGVPFRRYTFYRCYGYRGPFAPRPVGPPQFGHLLNSPTSISVSQ